MEAGFDDRGPAQTSMVAARLHPARTPRGVGAELKAIGLEEGGF